VLYTFHYYEPFQFTHQGASWNAARFLADVPYPANARPLKATLDAALAAIAASRLSQTEKVIAGIDARRMLESYRRSGFDRVAIGKSLDRIVAWAHSNDVSPRQIYLGEFGVMKRGRLSDAARAERRQWFADVRAAADERGFIWSAWVYRGAGGFALTNGEDIDIDPDIAASLALTSRSRHSSAPIE
jgi:hypothetical protein